MSRIIHELFDRQMITFGNAIMKNKRPSPIYVNLRPLISHPDVMNMVADAMLEKLKEETFLGRKLAGLPQSGLPLAVVIGSRGRIPVVYPRVDPKRGERSVEGCFTTGDELIAIDDLITDGAIKIEQVKQLRSVGAWVRDVLVVVEREEGGGRQNLESETLRLHSLFTLRQIVDILKRDCGLAEYEYQRTLAYLENP